MKLFTDVRFEDLVVGPLGTWNHTLAPEAVELWRSLLKYPPGEGPPSSLALTWLLQSLRQALNGIPSGGVLMRHELTFGVQPRVGGVLQTSVAVSEKRTHRGKPVAVFGLDTVTSTGPVVNNRMYLLWPSETETDTSRKSVSPARSRPTVPAGRELLRGSFSQKDINTYADLTGDYNPLHVDPDAGQRSRFGSTIAHGPMPLALVQMAIEQRRCTDWPTGLVLDAAFRNPTRPDEPLVVRRAAGGEYYLVDDSDRVLIAVTVKGEADGAPDPR